MFLPFGDLTDASSLRKVLKKAQPSGMYNLGAQSYVKVCIESMVYGGCGRKGDSATLPCDSSDLHLEAVGQSVAWGAST